MMAISYLRIGLRQLVRNPLSSGVSVMILALGIGATTAIFSLVNAVLLRPLPYEGAERLVFIWETLDAGLQRIAVSYPDFLDWREQSGAFDHLVAYSECSYTLSTPDSAEQISGELVSAGYFEMLGVEALAGRPFAAEEDRSPGSPPIAVLSHSLRRQFFGEDAAAVGRTVRINGQARTVIGVMPQGFRGLSGEADVWLPMIAQTEAIPELAKYDSIHQRAVRWHLVVGRLRPDVSLQEAQHEMEAVASRLAQSYPDTNPQLGAVVVALQDELVGEARQRLLLLLGAVGFVLLIACANLALLLLARGRARQREAAIRTAVGASGGQLVRQLLTESVLLAFLGGGAGVLLAFAGVEVLGEMFAAQIPSIIQVDIDRRVLAFAIGISGLTGVLIGALPALEMRRPDLQTLVLADRGGAAGTSWSRRIRRGLLVFEIAVTLALLTGAVLLMTALRQAGRIELGFQREERVALRIDLPAGKYSPEESGVFSQELLATIRSVPGVRGAALIYDLPFDDQWLRSNFSVEGYESTDSEEEMMSYQHAISSDLFSTLGIPLLEGREFSAQDDHRAVPVAIVSKSMAQRYWPGESSLDRRIKMARADNAAKPWRTVVGVVDDVRYRSLLDDPDAAPDVYLPFLQEPTTSFGLVVQARGDTADVVSALRREIGRLDRDLPLYNVDTLEQRAAGETSGSRLGARLMGVSAGFALLLAVVGIYGSVAYSTRQRTREIGIRMAMGAGPSKILKLILLEGFSVAVLGAAAGVALAFATTRLLSGLLYGVNPADPGILAGVSALVVGIVLLASYLPARSAAGIDPVIAMRGTH